MTTDNIREIGTADDALQPGDIDHEAKARADGINAMHQSLARSFLGCSQSNDTRYWKSRAIAAEDDADTLFAALTSSEPSTFGTQAIDAHFVALEKRT